AICRDAVGRWNGRVLILAHVKELLEQTAGTLANMAPDLDIGVYSAGLKRRDTEHSVIVAGIQSVYKRACDLDAFDLVMVDEAHMIPPSGEGMYRQFLVEAKVINPTVRVIGLTATPYRMTTGMICAPDHFLNQVCYEVGVRELIVQGYLSPLKSKAGKVKADTSGLHIRGGEFVADEVEDLMDQEHLVRMACREIVEHTLDRRSVLIFASGIQHAEHIQSVLRSMGQECGFICGETLPFERADTLACFRARGLKYLCNVNVLTTGFDAPNIDCVAMLRPTLSPGLYYQMVGRGFRLCEGKEDCLILDFGGNILRHGPVDALQIKEQPNGNGMPPAKECPECQAVIHAAYSICPECGYEFPPPERKRHDAQASTAGVLSGETTDTEYEVRGATYSVHVKQDADPDHPCSMRVDYQIGYTEWQSEWVCFEHTGYARTKAEAWWRERSDEPPPGSADEAVEICESGDIAETLAIRVRRIAGQKYDRIIGYTLGPKPRLPGWEDEDPVAVPAWAESEEIPF
ncbi:MAG TPA: helicase-related protein, partial [Thermoleophilia bacterium]|nr:helicase-related protein [Thermoleophilia bacterium]